MKLSQGAFKKIEKIRNSCRKRTSDSGDKIYELFNTNDISCNPIRAKWEGQIDETWQKRMENQEFKFRCQRIAYFVNATCELYGGEAWRQELEKAREALKYIDKPEQKSAEWLVAQLYRLNPNKILYTTNNRDIWYAWKAEELIIPEGFDFVTKWTKIYLSNKVNHGPNEICVEIPIYD